MSSVLPTVEERIRSALVLCQALKYSALLADENPIVVIPTFTPRDILRLFPDALNVLTAQLAAARLALPPECLNAPAPLVGRTQ